MKTTINLIVVITLALTIFSACNSQKEKKTEKETAFVLTGTVEGLQDGNIYMYYSNEGEGVRDTAKISEGKFVFKGDMSEICRVYLQADEPNRFFQQFYGESGEITITGKMDSLQNLLIKAGKAQEEFHEYNKGVAAISKKYVKYNEEYNKKETTDERRKELREIFDNHRTEVNEYNKVYIKENPGTYHAAVLATSDIRGKSALQTEKLLSELPAEMQNNPMVIQLRKHTEEMKEFEVGLDKIMANASNVSYKVDEKFNGKELTEVIYLSVFKNNNLCALKKDGTVQTLTTDGKEVSNFKPKLEASPSSIAVDADDNIYLMCTEYEEVIKKVRGKERKMNMPAGVCCNVFTRKGEPVTKFNLEGLITATGARVVDNQLIVSDCRNAVIAMFDKSNGEPASKIKEMRPCCGILDFSVNDKKEILVANLGAFRVQGFDFTGKKLVQFGSRGKELNEFQGCCNPVSVAYLSNGAIVTVEKDPTRIKVYSKEGAKQIEGVEELVKGCSYIPMIVDAQDNLYLASAKKGLVKCIAAN